MFPGGEGVAAACVRGCFRGRCLLQANDDMSDCLHPLFSLLFHPIKPATWSEPQGPPIGVRWDKGGGAMSTGGSLPGNGKGQLNYRYWFMFDSYITVDQHLNGSRKPRYSLLIEPLYCAR